MSYLLKSNKSKAVIKIIEEAIDILALVGIPIENKTERSLERMAMAFLSVAGVTEKWEGAMENRFLKTRDIILFNNTNFEENISSGSYDDIRRKDLKMLVLSGIILNSSDNILAATNDPRRGYSLEDSFLKLIKKYGSVEWETEYLLYMEGKTSLKSQLERNREIEKIPILLPNGKELKLSSGQHNILQKQIIEEFLPRYGKGCQILYVGDTANKMLYMDNESLKKLNFFELSHDELPDILAYNSEKNWLYIIEAVHSSGSINEIRLLELKQLTKDCTAEIIYVTAFLNRAEFRKWASEIAWETEVWVADNPDHLIHFNGNKFLGPYKSH
jgi:type II restriction enzyme